MEKCLRRDAIEGPGLRFLSAGVKWVAAPPVPLVAEHKSLYIRGSFSRPEITSSGLQRCHHSGNDSPHGRKYLLKIGDIISLTTLSTADGQKKATKESSFEGDQYVYLNETLDKKSYAVAEIFV